MCEESESEDEQEEAAKPKRPTRSAYEKELNKLLKYSGKDWTRLLRGLTFKLDGVTNTIMEVEYRSSSKFEVSGWVASYKDSEGAYDESFKQVLEWSRGEDWYNPIYDDYVKKKF